MNLKFQPTTNHKQVALSVGYVQACTKCLTCAPLNTFPLSTKQQYAANGNALNTECAYQYISQQCAKSGGGGWGVGGGMYAQSNSTGDFCFVNTKF